MDDTTSFQEGENFAEIRAGRGVLSEEHGKLKRVLFPIVIHNPEADWRYMPLSMIMAFSGFVGVVRPHGHPVPPIVGLLLGIFGSLIFASVIARQKLGAGTVSIEAAGFRDSRIGPDLILWSACERCSVVRGRAGMPISGVSLMMHPGAALPHLSSIYRWAFRILSRKGRPIFYIELKGTEQKDDVAAAVVYLVGKHGGPLKDSK